RYRDGRWYWHWDPEILTNSLVDPDDMLAAARAVQVPVLIVRGGSSDVVSWDGVKELQKALVKSTVAEVEGAGHMVAGDSNDTFGEVIAGFLSGLDGVSAAD